MTVSSFVKNIIDLIWIKIFDFLFFLNIFFLGNLNSSGFGIYFEMLKPYKKIFNCYINFFTYFFSLFGLVIFSVLWVKKNSKSFPCCSFNLIEIFHGKMSPLHGKVYDGEMKIFFHATFHDVPCYYFISMEKIHHVHGKNISVPWNNSMDL